MHSLHVLHFRCVRCDIRFYYVACSLGLLRTVSLSFVGKSVFTTSVERLGLVDFKDASFNQTITDPSQCWFTSFCCLFFFFKLKKSRVMSLFSLFY